MKGRRKIKQSGKKVPGKRLDTTHKIVNAPKARRVARTSGKRAPQRVTSRKRKTAGAKRSTAWEAGKAVGTFLGKAIGKAERLLNTTAETAKGLLG